MKELFFKLACSSGLLWGAISFAWAIRGEEPWRAWGDFLINLIFWTGTCMGSVTWVAIMNITNAKWGRPIKRIAEAQVVMLPLLWCMVAILYLGHKSIYPWATHSIHGKEIWLKAEFLFGRDLLIMGIMVLICVMLVYESVKADKETLLGANEGELHRRWRRQRLLSPVLGILYGVGMSILAWDLIMSLDPHWVSTLFGGYYFMGSLYTALAWISVISFVFYTNKKMDGTLNLSVFHDVGKLLFAFCLVTGDFFYSQFLVIWYGNIPEETKYVILRVRSEPWSSLAWAVLILAFGIPFVALLSRRLKMIPQLLAVTAALVLIGMWLERLLLVAPSVRAVPEIPLGWLEVSMAVGFLCLQIICLRWFVKRVPWVPVGDPLFKTKRGASPNGISIATVSPFLFRKDERPGNEA